MLQRVLTDPPEGFEYPLILRKEIAVIGNKDWLGSDVHGAPKCKVVFLHHVVNDNAMKAYIEKNMCKVQSFEKASNPASSAKSFRVKVLVDNAKKMLDATVWPSGTGCNIFYFLFFIFFVLLRWLLASTNQLKIFSYNSTGFSDDKLKYLTEQSLEFDIILVQEHWLLSNDLKRIKNGVVNFTGIGNSGMDET